MYFVFHTLASLLIYTLVAVFGTSGNHAIDSKNRVWNFFSSPSVFVGKNHSQVVESQQEKIVLTENITSGMPEYRARYYDPVMGRFLSEDPIGDKKKMKRQMNGRSLEDKVVGDVYSENSSGFSGGDFNLQRYTFNSPFIFFDVYGTNSNFEKNNQNRKSNEYLMLTQNNANAIKQAQKAFRVDKGFKQYVHKVWKKSMPKGVFKNRNLSEDELLEAFMDYQTWL